MLSILIPCYNYSSFDLVKTLYQQCVVLKIDFEILVSEDAGDKHIDLNQKINTYDNCQYIINQKNLGRAGNINRLLRWAQYHNKIILDCDVLPQQNNFIKTYLDLAEHHEDLVCFGGVTYHHSIKFKKNLRYNYGIKREARPAAIRQNKPYKYLLTSNLLLKNCDQFFDERIQTYGYEDLVFANELKHKSANVIHLDNPVFHVNLEDNRTYLSKTQIALETLSHLEKQRILEKGETNISKLYHGFKSFYLQGLICFLYHLIAKHISRYLITKGRPLWWFDVYKLLYFSKNY